MCPSSAKLSPFQIPRHLTVTSPFTLSKTVGKDHHTTHKSNFLNRWIHLFLALISKELFEKTQRNTSSVNPVIGHAYNPAENDGSSCKL